MIILRTLMAHLWSPKRYMCSGNRVVWVHKVLVYHPNISWNRTSTSCCFIRMKAFRTLLSVRSIFFLIIYWQCLQCGERNIFALRHLFFLLNLVAIRLSTSLCHYLVAVSWQGNIWGIKSMQNYFGKYCCQYSSVGLKSIVNCSVYILV